MTLKPAPAHVITIKGDRVDIECQNCKDGMDVSATSALGAAMIELWPEKHKCSKAAKK